MIYTAPLIISVALGLGLALSVARYRAAIGATALIGLLVSAAVWSGAYALEILATDLSTKILWAKVQYFGIVAIPPAWVIFASQFVGAAGWLARPRNRVLLAAIPGVTLGLVWTNEMHGLVWPRVQLQLLSGTPMLEVGHGPWFWIYVVFGYALLLVGSVLLGKALFSSVRLHRWQFWLALLAIAIPWMGNFIYMLDLGPEPHVDWTPFAFVVAGLIFSVSLFRFDLVRIVPIAQKSVFDGLADCVVVLDLQGNIVDLNPAALTMAGCPGTQAIGKPLAGVRPDIAAWVERTGPAGTLELAMPAGDGEPPRSYELRLSTLTGRHRAPVGRVVVWHDITQHVLQQAQLESARAQLEATVARRTEALRQAVDQLQQELDQRQRAGRRFEEMVEAAPDGLLLVDEAGTIRLVNAQAERLFGYSRDELLGQNMERLIPAHHHAGHRQGMPAYMANPSILQLGLELDAQAQRKDGSLFPVEISLGPLGTGAGVWVTCNVRDISERRRAQQSLLESEQTYRVLFENAGDALILIGLDGAILRANQKATDLLGYSRDELQAMSLVDIVVASEAEEARAIMRSALEGHTLKPFVRTYRNRVGEPVPVEVNVALVRDPAGKPLYFQHIARDIRERLQAEQAQARLLEEVRQSREELRALAARLEAVRESERRDIAVELHDRVGQNLTGLNLNLQIVQNQLAAGDSASVRGRLDDALHLVEATTRQVRDVMADLHPPELDEYGLVAALRWYCRRFADRDSYHRDGRRVRAPLRAAG